LKASTDKLSGQLCAALGTYLLSHHRMFQRAPRKAVEASRVVYTPCACRSPADTLINTRLVCHADKIRLDPTNASFCEDVLETVVGPGELDY